MERKHVQKTLTVMFTDISGFTRTTSAISRRGLMQRLETHNDLLMPIVAHFEGRIVKSIGDAFLITFESPTNAVQCGLFMQHTLRQYNAERSVTEQIHIKVSINTGEVTETEDDVFGDPVNVAAKVEKASEPDEIYFTEAVFLSMNKAEVPNAFVRTFRPKGVESEEVKLFRVVQDENDAVYRRIVEDTVIDPEQVAEQVARFSSVAEREFRRYQETLEHLIEEQGRSGRKLFVGLAVGAAALIVLLVAALAVYLPAAGGPSAEEQAIDGARAYLSAGRVEDARSLVAAAIAENGTSEALAGMLAEIRTYELNDAERRAGALFEEGHPVRAAAALEEALRDEAPGGSRAILLERCRAFSDARRALAAGRTEVVRERVAVAAGDGEPNEFLADLLRRAHAVDEVREILDGPRPEARAAAAVEILAAAYGDATDESLALDLLTRALMRTVHEVGRTQGPARAEERLDAYRERFLRIVDWSVVERESILGSLWFFTSDYEWRKRWRNWHDTRWREMIEACRSLGADDARFLWRLGATRFGVTRRNHLAVADGMEEIEAALALEPGLADEFDDELHAMALDWLQWEQAGEDDFGRRILLERYRDRIGDRVLDGLDAWVVEDDPSRGARRSERANCFLLLVALDRVREIDNLYFWWRDNLGLFLEGSTPLLPRPASQALFGASLSWQEYESIRGDLDFLVDEVARKEGRWAAHGEARSVLTAMVDDLDRLQPIYAQRWRNQ